jgi:hypothetical protein
MARIHRYCWWRLLRTTNERRANTGDATDARIEGEPPPVRRSRLGYNLPSAWDDIVRCAQRSWKKHRKRQFRRIADMGT